jgi:hypothetical protein
MKATGMGKGKGTKGERKAYVEGIKFGVSLASDFLRRYAPEADTETPGAKIAILEAARHLETLGAKVAAGVAKKGTADPPEESRIILPAAAAPKS